MDKLPSLKMDSARLSAISAEATKRRQYAKSRASILLGCFRTGDANDPEVYIAAVVAVLARYPESVIRDVTEPASGLPARLKWLPTIAEIREECDVLDARIKRREERERQIAEQFAARDAERKLIGVSR
jgi:hypothetical protein